MDCKQVRNRLSVYQDGTLDAIAEAALADHLRGCGECAGADASLLAVRELLRGLHPDPAPPELLGRVLAAVEAEGRDVRSDSTSGGAVATRPFLSRLRIPLEAAAVVLLFASVYWYQRIPASTPTPPSGLSSEAGKVSASRPTPAKEDAPKIVPPGILRPRGEPKTAKEAGPSAPKPRTWTAASLPTVPALRASTDSGRIVPVAPVPMPMADPAAAGGPAPGERRMTYGRDISVGVNPENREGAEERIVEATVRFGGIVERIERGGAGAGTVRVIMPEAAAGRFLDELRRIGTVPPEALPSEIDIPAGPRPGTVAYAVRIR